MDISPIAYAIPLFFVLIGLEVLVARHRGLEVYRYHDAITDLSCGIGSRVVGVAGKVLGLAGYTAVWHFVGVARIESGVAAWVAVILGVDFFYYWLHRAGHRMNIVWAGHVVHHQSEDYNLAVALRQSWYIPFIEWIFYLPLAVIGFSPLMYAGASAINTLYQFWIHTETVGRIGPLEAVLNTPSHHRVHHGTNPEYIDKNYGGILIIWDKLFGTFEPEVAPSVYGTIKPLRSWNPLWANVANWVEMGQQFRLARGPADAARILLGPPGWTPDGIPPAPAVSRDAQQKYVVQSSRLADWYVGLSYLTAIIATTGFMVVQTALEPVKLAVFGALIAAGIISWGGLLEGRRWACFTELARLVVAPIAAWHLSEGNTAFVASVAMVSLLSAVPVVAMVRGSGGRVG